MKTYIFKTKYWHDKKISRKIEVLGNVSLYKLAKAIVDAYGFDFDHCFGFFSNLGNNYFKSEKQYELFADLPDVEPTRASSVKKTKVLQVWKDINDKMLFLFSFLIPRPLAAGSRT